MNGTVNSFVDSYYSRTSDTPPQLTPLRGVIDCDVCVIGGGLAGLATALGLAQRGVGVTLVEAERPGWGASGRNGGFVGPGFSLDVLALAKRVGDDCARELYALTESACELVRARLGDKQTQIVLPVEGSVNLGWFDEADARQGYVDKVNLLLDTELEYWPRERVAQYYLSDCYHDGIFKPTTMQMHSLNFVHQMVMLAEDAGAQLFVDSRVTAVERKINGWRVVTSQGLVHAGQVVFAGSAYLGKLEPRLARAVLPVATYVLLTEPLGERLQTAIRAPYPAGDSRFSSNYYRVVEDRRLLWGGRVSMFQPSPKRLLRIMLGDLLSVYPQLQGVQGEVAWGGSMAYARHKMPLIGRLGDGAWYCTGFGGHGMATTTLGGDLVARGIAEQDDTYRLFEPFGLDFVGTPFGPAVAQTAYWYYQARDRLKTKGRSNVPE